ncbi:MAG: helix-turn-helix domain-containing protein [Butyricicoccus sp.]|nr:helix-turn-helix domain-containing protein [Butyricicoccus sp.]
MVKNLRKLRINAKLTQQELADAIGITQQSINKYENHGVEPDIYMLIKLSDYFHTTVDYLVGHTPVPDQIATEELELNCAELSFIKDFRSLSDNEKKSIQLVVKNYLRHK